MRLNKLLITAVFASLSIACLPTAAPSAIAITPTPQGTPVPPAPALLQPLHVDGLTFKTADGQPFTWAGFSDFALYLRYLRGENIDLILNERVGVGANTLRVFGMWNNPHLAVEEHPDYFDRLRPFADLLAQHGLRLEFVVFTDAQILMPDQAAQLAHWQRVGASFGQAPNVSLMVVNQGAKNGVDSLAFPVIPGYLNARDSGMEDANPPLPSMGYSGYTSSRSSIAKGVAESCSSMFYVVNGWGPGTEWQGTHEPSINDEPYGFDETYQPGRRLNDPALAYQLGACAALFGNGGTFHSTDGTQSNYLGPIQKASAVAFFRGVHAVQR